MKVELLWELNHLVWRQNTDGTEKASTFIVMVGEQLTSRG